MTRHPGSSPPARPSGSRPPDPGGPDYAPDYASGYLRVPLAVWLGVFCRAPLTRRQLQLVAAVLRESWGWQGRGGGVRTWTRPLSPRHFASLTGLSTDRIARDLRDLVRRGALEERERRYRLVPDVARWGSGGRPASGPEPPAESTEPSAVPAPRAAASAPRAEAQRQRERK